MVPWQTVSSSSARSSCPRCDALKEITFLPSGINVEPNPQTLFMDLCGVGEEAAWQPPPPQPVSCSAVKAELLLFAHPSSAWGGGESLYFFSVPPPPGGQMVG